MKKLFIIAALVAATSSAFAQDVKTILKSKDYTEARGLVQSALASLSNEDKAKAYNHLVELSLAKINKESQTMTENQMMEQMGQKGDKPVDKAGLYAAVHQALADAAECDKYDNMPNAKNKLAPKFHKKNQAVLWTARQNLINAGQDAGKKDDTKGALENYSAYVESAQMPLFDDLDKTKAPDLYLGEVARVAAVYAFQDKDMDRANRYCDIALNDTASYKDALNLKMYLMQSSMKTKEDSVKCLQTFEDLYAKNPSETVFSNLATLYGNLNMTDKQDKLIADHLVTDPKCFNAYALKGQTEMNNGKFDAAIEDFKKANAIEPKAIVLTYIGYCYNSKAGELQDPAKQKAMFEQSVGYLEQARKLDPDRKDANWSYPLYQTYYNLYGPDDSRTKELESLVK